MGQAFEGWGRNVGHRVGALALVACAGCVQVPPNIERRKSALAESRGSGECGGRFRWCEEGGVGLGDGGRGQASFPKGRPGH